MSVDIVGWKCWGWGWRRSEVSTLRHICILLLLCTVCGVVSRRFETSRLSRGCEKMKTQSVVVRFLSRDFPACLVWTIVNSDCVYFGLSSSSRTCIELNI